MTQSVSPSLFFLLDKPVQLQILKQLPVATLDNISRVCKQCLELRKEIQEAICDKTLPLIKKLTVFDGNGFRSRSLAASALLSNCRSIEAQQKVELIQLKNGYQIFSELTALIPSYPPAENLAKKVISGQSNKSFDYLKLFSLTKNIEYFFKAFPEPMSPIKNPGLWINIYCNTAKVNNVIDVIYLLPLLIAFAEISSNPKSILEKARSIRNETSVLDCTDKFKHSLQIYLVYLKLFPSTEKDDFASLLYEELCKYHSGWPSDDIALFEAIKQIVSRNAPLARLFAEKITHPNTAVDAHLTIADFTKDPADLRQIKFRIYVHAFKGNSSDFVEGLLKKYQIAFRTAISPMNDISLARELADHLMISCNDPKVMTDYRAFKAYIRIYKDFKQPEDLEQAEKIAGNIEYEPNKIKAYRTLYELIKDKRFYQLGVNILVSVKQEDRPHACAEDAVLTNNTKLLDMAFEINNFETNKNELHKFDILKMIFNICLHHFRDFPRAREYVRKMKMTSDEKNFVWEKKELLKMLAVASKEPNDITSAKSNSVLVTILKQLILEKKFEEAVAFEKDWFNSKQTSQTT